MQNINYKKYLNIKTFFYAIILVFAYYLGDSDLENLIYKRLNIDIKEGEYLVTKIVDGDTVHVKDNSGKEEILRFLAVDTLEKNSSSTREKCLANMQTEFTKESLLNKKVFLETDPTQGERDKYGRLLVYVSIGGSTSSVYVFNEILLETGNAKVYKANPPAKEYERYLDLQTEAQKNKLGMWNTELCN